VAFRKIIATLAGFLGVLPLAVSAFAGGIYVNSPNGYVRSNSYRAPYYGNGYANPYYNSNVVIIEQNQPLLVPRYGSNDALYTYDNIYGPEASAAGRLSPSSNYQQPFYNVYYPR